MKLSLQFPCIFPRLLSIGPTLPFYLHKSLSPNSGNILGIANSYSSFVKLEVIEPPSYWGSYKIIVCLSVCLPACLPACQPACLPARLPACPSFSLAFFSELTEGSKWPQNRFFFIFWKILSLVFLENNLKWKLIRLLILHHQSHIRQNYEKEVNNEVYFWHADKHKTSASWYYRFGCVQPGMSKVRKIRSFHIFAISPEKHRGGEVGFLPANKHKRFL